MQRKAGQHSGIHGFKAANNLPHCSLNLIRATLAWRLSSRNCLLLAFTNLTQDLQVM
jgi:hypothetical protein